MVSQRSTNAVVSDGDDCAVYIEMISQIGQIVRATEYLDPVNSSSDVFEIGIDEPDDLIRTDVVEDIQHDSAMTPTAQNDAFSRFFLHGRYVHHKGV